MQESRKPSDSSQKPAGKPSLRAKLYRYRGLVRRFWWIVLLAVSASLCVQGYMVSQEAPTYVSSARMWVSGKVNLPEGGLYREELQNFFGTQIELMRSELLQNRTRARVKLLNPKLEPSGVGVKVLQAPRAAVFILQAVGLEPQYTRAYLQALMEEYLAYKKELRGQASDEALSAVTEQLYKPQKELKEAQEALLTFQRENNVVFLTEQGSSAGGYLAKLNTRLSDLKTEYQFMELLATEQDVEKSSKLLSSSEAKATSDLNNQFAAFQKVTEQLRSLEAERQDLGQYLKDKHPKIIKLEDEIARQKRFLEIVRQQGREQMSSTRQSLKLQIQNLESSIKEWESKASESSRKMAEYERLKVNVARVQSLYDRLLNTVQSVNVNKNLDQENVSIMENASAALSVRSGLGRKMTMAAILGLLAGIGILYFIDRHDDRIGSVSELMQEFDEFAVIGHVPDLRLRKNQPIQLVHAHDNRHQFVEAFRDIRSALLFTADRGVRPKTILITSAIPNEGKSSVSANLAVTLALSGARVLLVDTDLRCGTVSALLGVESEPGLHEVLTQQTHFNQVLRTASTPNLHVITAGKLTPTAGELFLGAVTESFIKEIYPLYDYIIMDSAPVLATADTASLAPKVDAVLFVVRGAFTSARLSRQALELLRQRQVNILGLILNRADTSYPEYYQYKYSKYYHRTAVPA